MSFFRTLLTGSLTAFLLFAVNDPVSAQKLCVGSNSDARVPNASIQEAESNVPVGYTKFLGFWGNASWDGKLCHVLVITSVNKYGEAKVLYSTGISEDWYINTPNVSERKGIIRDGVLTLEWQSRSGKNRLATYRFNSGGNLEGVYTIDRGSYYTEPHLSKISTSK